MPTYSPPEILGSATPHADATLAVAVPRSNPPAVSYARLAGEHPQFEMMLSC
jgi:hypothetical protein